MEKQKNSVDRSTLIIQRKDLPIFLEGANNVEGVLVIVSDNQTYGDDCLLPEDLVNIEIEEEPGVNKASLLLEVMRVDEESRK